MDGLYLKAYGMSSREKQHIEFLSARLNDLVECGRKMAV